MKPKKFIKAAYNGELGLTMCQEWKDKILEHYPEFKEEEFKIGDWVVNKNHPKKFIGRITEIESDTSLVHYNGKDYKNDIRKATPEEIEEHLIKEANRRGLIKGVMVKGLDDCYYGKYNSMVISDDGYLYDCIRDLLYVKSTNGDFIGLYKKGKWAEPIETITKQEAENLLNKRIID